jgi:predicted component of type VI protein secretion system
MDARLVVVEGKASRNVVQLKLPTIIGRSREADVKVGHSSVSRIHCEIYELDGALVVRDAGSLNGTFIDGMRVTEAVLKPGDRLTVGPLTFVAEYEHQGGFPVLPVRPAPSPSITVPDEAVKRRATPSASSTAPGFSPPPVPIPVDDAADAPSAPPPAGDHQAQPVRMAEEHGGAQAAEAGEGPLAASSVANQSAAAGEGGAPASTDLPPTLDMPAGYAVVPTTPDPLTGPVPPPVVPPAAGGGQQVDEDDDDLQNFFQELGLK